MKKLISSLLVFMLVVLALPPAMAQEGNNPAEILPAETPLYISIDTRAGFVDGLENFIGRLTQMPVTGELRSGLNLLAQTLLMDQEATFADDVRPWFGDEIALALPDMPLLMSLAMSSSGNTPPTLNAAMIAAVTDTAKAEAVLTRFLDEYMAMPAMQNVEIEESAYKGISYIKLQGQQPPTLNVGVVGDYLVVSIGVSAMQTFINAANGSIPSLADARSFQRIYGTLDPGSAMRIYIGSSLLAAPLADPFVSQMLTQAVESGELEMAIQQLSAESNIDLSALNLDLDDPEALQAQLVALVDTVDGLGIGFSGRGNAMVMDWVAGVDLEALEAILGEPVPVVDEALLIDGAIYDYLPADTLGVYVAGIPPGWYESQLPAAMQGADFAEANRQFQGVFGQGIAETIGWVEGDIALGFVGNPDFRDPDTELPIKLVFLFEAGDLDQAEATLAAVRAAVEREAEDVTVETVQVDGVDVMTFTPRAYGAGPQVIIEAALLDNYLAFTTDGAMAQVIETARGGTNYTGTPQWERVTAIGNANGLMFSTLEIGKLMDMVIALGEETGDLRPADRMVFQQLKLFETAAIIAPQVAEGAPAHVTLFITLAE